jgi:hypothetical protein
MERGGTGIGFYRGVEPETGREFIGAGGRTHGDDDPLAGSGIDHATIWTDEAILPGLSALMASRGSAGRAAR